MASRSSTFKFGWGAHNYLGFADAWGLTGDETDAQLLDTFEAPSAIRNDPEARSQWLYFLRHNAGPPTPLPRLSINDVSVTEGDTGTKNAVFTVTLSPASSRWAAVRFTTANGTALAGKDYAAFYGTLAFDPGQTTKTITVAIKGDTLDEPNERLFINLSSPINATISDRQGVCSIVNDD